MHVLHRRDKPWSSQLETIEFEDELELIGKIGLRNWTGKGDKVMPYFWSFIKQVKRSDCILIVATRIEVNRYSHPIGADREEIKVIGFIDEPNLQLNMVEIDPQHPSVKDFKPTRYVAGVLQK